ncbi:MAG TPA: phosphodiester glycosidase family protein [Ruminiclostridium sp.]
MKKNNQKLVIIIGMLIILSSIIFYVGQFLFSVKRTPDQSNLNSTVIPNSEIDSKQPFPVEYKQVSAKINGHKQEIFTLEFDPLDKRIEFKPVLSYDNVFGFEKMTDICKRTGAYAVINGGFFYEYGDPVGMVTIDGNVFMASTGYDPVLIIDKKGANFKKVISQLSFFINSGKTTINKLNRIGQDGNIVLYTSDYGSTNRAKIKNTSVRVENSIVTYITRDTMEVPLKKDSYLISFFGEESLLPNKLGIKEGDKINIEIKPQFDGKYQAYECGSLLVKDGISVVPDKDRWVGSLKNRDPRTAIGIKEDGRVVLIVVDGRQPDYSSGFTGDELANYLIQMGVKDAAMLDGGATSQMLVDGSLKNKPSYRGIERPVAGAFIVKVN